ncbi:ABC transporter permease [Cellulomonas hominis]
MLPVVRGLVAGGTDPWGVVASMQAGLSAVPLDGAAASVDDIGSGPAAGRPSGDTRSRRLRQVLIVLGWLLVWEIADRVVGNRLILTGPVRTLDALAEQAADPDFWLIALASSGRIALGFLGAFLGGIGLALVAHRSEWFRDALSPVMSVLRTVPMVSFVVMLLIWVGSQALTVWLAFLIVVPLLYTSMATGLASVDRRQREMAQVFRVSAWKRFLYIDRPVFMPFVTSACRVGLGMSWKAGIMAEVFATPTTSIGKEMFQAKTFLDTPALFAWTVVVMVLSLVFERSVMLALRFASRPLGGLLGRRT